MTGPFIDEKGGGMFVINVEGRKEAEEIVNNYPAIINGLSEAKLRPYKIVMKK